MTNKKDSNISKGKPRGKPFPKGNIKGMPANDVLEDDEKVKITLKPREKTEYRGIVSELDEFRKKDYEFASKEVIEVLEEANKKIPPLEEVDIIEFKNGENILKITLRKKHNRMFRIQVFLNDETEIRPVTYTGSSTAMGFWNLLKGSLKK